MEDLVQDVFVKAFTRVDTLLNPQAFAKWIGTITVHLASKRLRRQRLKQRLFLSRSEAMDADAFLSRETPPDVAAELSTLYAILGSLEPDARVALVLRRVEGMTIPEVADHMGRSPATVKRRLQEAETLLSARLGRELGGAL